MKKIKEKIKEMTLDEFEKEYNQPSENWRFDLFKIVCSKCGSNDVEYNGKTEIDYGYYGEVDFTHFLVVKCHKCGNAFGIKQENSGSSEYCPEQY
jgi:predicted nucleic-acid-binding Zn-ribbon protein